MQTPREGAPTELWDEWDRVAFDVTHLPSEVPYRSLEPSERADWSNQRVRLASGQVVRGTYDSIEITDPGGTTARYVSLGGYGTRTRGPLRLAPDGSSMAVIASTSEEFDHGWIVVWRIRGGRLDEESRSLYPNGGPNITPPDNAPRSALPIDMRFSADGREMWCLDRATISGWSVRDLHPITRIRRPDRAFDVQPLDCHGGPVLAAGIVDGAPVIGLGDGHVVGQSTGARRVVDGTIVAVAPTGDVLTEHGSIVTDADERSPSVCPIVAARAWRRGFVAVTSWGAVATLDSAGATRVFQPGFEVEGMLAVSPDGTDLVVSTGPRCRRFRLEDDGMTEVVGWSPPTRSRYVVSVSDLAAGKAFLPDLTAEREVDVTSAAYDEHGALFIGDRWGCVHSSDWWFAVDDDPITALAVRDSRVHAGTSSGRVVIRHHRVEFDEVLFDDSIRSIAVADDGRLALVATSTDAALVTAPPPPR